MKRSDLDEKGKAEFDHIISEMMEEIEQIPPLPPNVLSQAHNKCRREIEKKYIPRLQACLIPKNQRKGPA